MSELLYPVIDPKKYLELATQLSEKSETECMRTAVDRAYYATFLFCRDNLCAKGYITPYGFGDDHKYVIEKLRESDILGSWGNQAMILRETRNDVTYKLHDINKKHNVRSVKWALNTAKEIIERTEQLPNRIPKQH